jgi:competence protein ComGC
MDPKLNQSNNEELSPKPTQDDSLVNNSDENLATQQTSIPSALPESTKESSSKNTPGTIILQWLTYAFWGWTVLVSGVLATASISNMVLGADTGEFTTYALAAVLVLLPISIVCDIFYSKNEPQKKTGAAMVVMVIHAVLFALIGIGTLITAVFAVVQMLTNGGQVGWSKVTLYSALVCTILYVATFLRTLNPQQLPWLSKAYKLFMIVAVLIITVLCVVGPISYEYATKNDKLIVANINTIESSVNSYTQKNNKLPSSLNDLKLSGDAKLLVQNNLVKYTPGDKNTKESTASSKTKPYYVTSYTYTLCVNYAKPDNNLRTGTDYSSYDQSGSLESGTTEDDTKLSSGYVRTSGHPAGEVCYKLKTDNDYNSGIMPL